jgi:RND family efflux transporter MFP subunit
VIQAGIALALLAAVGIGGFVAAQRTGMFGGNAEWLPEAIRARPEVRVAKVIVETGRSADAVVVATGYLESYRQAKIGARGAGRIEALHVEEGSRVKSGEVIAVLDHKDIDAALAAAKAALLRARAELGEHEVEIARSEKHLERNTKLRQTNVLTEAEFDRFYFEHRAAVARRETLQAAVVQAEARVSESEQFQENMIVRAPFDGTVISKDAEVGESILPGGMGEASGRGSVVTIADLDRLEVDCDVKEDYISRVMRGSPTEVAVDAVPDQRYSGRVRKVIPMGDRARATIKVKVEILDADERLFPNMSATVYFLPEPGEVETAATQRRIFCDSAAIVPDGKEHFVWAVDDDLRVRKVAVSIGGVRDSRTEILDGLSGGERVVVGPSEKLQSGQLVKLRE